MIQFIHSPTSLPRFGSESKFLSGPLMDPRTHGSWWSPTNALRGRLFVLNEGIFPASQVLTFLVVRSIMLRSSIVRWATDLISLEYSNTATSSVSSSTILRTTCEPAVGCLARTVRRIYGLVASEKHQNSHIPEPYSDLPTIAINLHIHLNLVTIRTCILGGGTMAQCSIGYVSTGCLPVIALPLMLRPLKSLSYS
jgi:hypothetical protein